MTRCYCCRVPDTLEPLDYWDSEHIICGDCAKILRNGLSPKKLREFLEKWEQRKREWLKEQKEHEMQGM